jgi:hypothetical protein
LSEKNIQLATKIGENRFTTVESADRQADAVLIATPPTVIFDILGQMGDKVSLLEQFAPSWIKLAIMQGHGCGMAFQVLRRWGAAIRLIAVEGALTAKKPPTATSLFKKHAFPHDSWSAPKARSPHI